MVQLEYDTFFLLENGINATEIHGRTMLVYVYILHISCPSFAIDILCRSSLFTMDTGKDQAGETKAIAVGPWGGNGGAYWDDGSYTGIREITLTYARCIDSINVVYDKNGKPVSTEKHGGVGGSITVEIKLQFPDEYLTSVSGHYYPVVHGGSSVIRSLTFKTNKRTFGPYGVEEGTPFSFPMEGGQIVGFKGRAGWYLDAIGFHITKTRTVANVVQKAQQRFRRLTSSLSLAPLRDGDEARKYGKPLG
ncbi:jacalin-related lectin 19 [Andrographis paniculata]|uniref:jacalin-related lectin 19 n=1 Tax=Andrographis paniculata TaxID=175694 RepID=UPI0021E8FE81|nr:jacalin-related lectin 19 [Andrographis paniculata]